MDELLHQLVCDLIIEVDGQGVVWGEDWDASVANKELIDECKRLIVQYDEAVMENFPS